MKDTATATDRELVTAALKIIRETHLMSIARLQRSFTIGFNHATRVMETLEQLGVVSKIASAAGRREILMDDAALEQMIASREQQLQICG